MALWTLLECDLCGMRLDRSWWIRGRPRASELRKVAHRTTQWRRVGFYQDTGMMLPAEQMVKAQQKRRPKGVQIVDVCGHCARRSDEDLAKEYRRKFVAIGGHYLDSWDD